jgi:intracellular sulfur oxidation DsrE/DsrF family protein
LVSSECEQAVLGTDDGYASVEALMAAIVLAGALVPPLATAQAPAQKTRLVVQVSDNDAGKWNLALNNVANVQKDLGAANVEIEVVAYGPGIGMLKAGSPVGDRVANALKSGVQVVACENTMTAQKLEKKDMLPNIGYVGAGVVELMKRQQQGWAYIRP